MKKNSLLLFLTSALIICLYACTNCKHGYKNPLTGNCYCDQGYTGTACDVSIVEEYAGVYNVSSACTVTGNSNFIATLSGNASNSEIQIVPVYGSNGVWGVVENNSVVLSGQFGGSPDVTVTGNGYIAGGTISMSLSVVDNSDTATVTETCTCTMVKQ